MLFTQTIKIYIILQKLIFKKISGKRYPNCGWIHKDDSELTGIVYLSKHKFCGTSLCKRIDFNTHQSSKNLVEYKKKFYSKNYYDEKESHYLKLNNQNYKRTLTVDSEYNRLFLFESANFHMAESFTDKDNNEDRLTLITFISNLGKVNGGLKFGLSESKRLD